MSTKPARLGGLKIGGLVENLEQMLKIVNNKTLKLLFVNEAICFNSVSIARLLSFGHQSMSRPVSTITVFVQKHFKFVV